MSTRTPPPMTRQGDLLLIRVPSIPGETRLVPRDAGRVVLAYGEVTGHAHAITDAHVELVHTEGADGGDAAVVRELLASIGLNVELRPEEIVGFLNVGNVAPDCAVVHEEHGPIPLLPGDRFLVLRQREYSPTAILRVED